MEILQLVSTQQHNSGLGNGPKGQQPSILQKNAMMWGRGRGRGRELFPRIIGKELSNSGGQQAACMPHWLLYRLEDPSRMPTRREKERRYSLTSHTTSPYSTTYLLPKLSY